MTSMWIPVKYLLIGSLLLEVRGQNPTIQKWTVNKDINWLNGTLFKVPNLYYEVKFVVEFERKNCCPILDLQSYIVNLVRADVSIQQLYMENLSGSKIAFIYWIQASKMWKVSFHVT